MSTDSSSQPSKAYGLRKNGKQWHTQKTAFRPTAGLTAYSQRVKTRQLMDTVKAKAKEMKLEKEEQRQRRIQDIKARRATQEEKERYEKLAAKMHLKRVERLKRREKRNKLLHS